MYVYFQVSTNMNKDKPLSSGRHLTMALNVVRYEMTTCCPANGVVEDRRFLRVAFEANTVSHGSYLTTFVKWSPPRNGSNYVKTVGVLMPHRWG